MSSCPVTNGAEESTPSAGVVELREDVPLKASSLDSGGGRYCAGPKFIVGCFGALSVAITVALLTQIYYGDYQVVPHGSVAGDAARCSEAGTDALKAGGGAADAAVAAAFCLAVLAPHAAGLDASGAMMIWDYRKSHVELPTVAEWGFQQTPKSAAGAGLQRTPRMVAALAAVHARFGLLPWPTLLQPAIDIARTGFPVSQALAIISTEVQSPLGVLIAKDPLQLPSLADYLESLQTNTSQEWSSRGAAVAWTPSSGAALPGGWRLHAGGAGAVAAAAALAELADARLNQAVNVMYRLQKEGVWPTKSNAATGLAVIDQRDVYVSLVIGLSNWFGSRQMTSGGWLQDNAPVEDLTPAILVEEDVCGRRYVVGAGSAAALVQTAAALTGGAPLQAAVERPRAAAASARLSALEGAANVVQQRGDQLAAHADSRAGGVASRF